MAEEIKIKISSEGADQVERELQKLQQAGQQAADSLPVGQHRPGESVPQTGASRLATEVNPTESTGTDQKAIGEQRRREYAARRAEAQDQAQEELNAQLVREEEKRQRAEAVVRARSAARQRAVEEEADDSGGGGGGGGGRVAGRVAGRLAHAAANDILPGSPAGGLTSAIGSAGGPVAAVIATIGSALAGVAASFAAQSRERELIELHDATAGASQARRLSRAAGFEGSAGGSRAAAESARDRSIELAGQRQEIEKESEFKWWSPSSWWDHVTGKSQNALEVNDRERVRAANEEAKQRKIQREKWEQQGALEVQAGEQRAAGNMRGSRDTQRTSLWWSVYNKAQMEGAPEWQARELAGLKTWDDMREENMKWAHLVSASSSRSDIARAVDLATGHIHGGSHHQQAQVSALEELVRMNRDHHGESVLRRFEPRSLRHQGGHS